MILEQKVSMLERNEYNKFTTNSGLTFSYNGTVSIDDIVIINKTWKVYEEKNEKLVSDEQILSYYNAVREHDIILKPYYEYHIENFGYPDGGITTYEYIPSFCEDAKNKSITYELTNVKQSSHNQQDGM